MPEPIVPLDPEAIAMGTGLGGIFGKVQRATTAPADAPIGGGNMLAHAARRAYDSLEFDDLDDLEPSERPHIIQQNGARYEQEAQDLTFQALARANEAHADSQAGAMKQIPLLVPEPAAAQRAFAHDALTGLSRAEEAIRQTGDNALADRLGEVADGVLDHSEAHKDGLAIDHDPGELLHTLNQAYEELRGAGQLPAEAQEALDHIRAGTEKPEYWGRAAEMLRDLREAQDATQDGGDLQDFSASMRSQLEVLGRWDIDTDDLEDSLDDLDKALRRGDQVAATKIAHSIDTDPSDTDNAAHPLNAVIQGAMAEAGVSGPASTVASQLPASAQQLARSIGSSFFYDQALRATQAGIESQVKRAARELVGLAPPRQQMPADAANQAFTAGYPDEMAAFEARRSMLESLHGDPTALIKALSTSYGDLAQTHPEVYAGLVEKAGTAAALLTEAMPPSVQKSLQYPRGVQPSVDDIRSFARNYVAIVDSDVFIGELASGNAWPEQTQYFKRMYPNRFAQLSKHALEAATMRGPAMTPQQATYLDLNFDLGNTIGGMWSDSGSKSIANAIESASAQKQKPPGGAPQQSALAPDPATMALGMGPTSAPIGA